MDVDMRSETREFLTPEQADRTLIDAMHALTQAENDLSAARGTHTHMMARYGGEGPTNAEIRREQDSILDAIECDIVGVAEAAFKNTRQVLSQYEAAARVALTAEEQQRASAIREEIKEDVATLDAVALRNRMVAVVTANDRASMHHLIRYVPLRPPGPGSGAPGEETADREIVALLVKMREALRDTSLDKQIELTRKILGDATDMRLNAGRRTSQREAAEAVARMNGGRRLVPVPSDEELARGMF